MLSIVLYYRFVAFEKVMKVLGEYLLEVEKRLDLPGIGWESFLASKAGLAFDNVFKKLNYVSWGVLLGGNLILAITLVIQSY